jgi:glycosidase
MRRLLGIAIVAALFIPTGVANAAPNDGVPSWAKSTNLYEVNVRQFSSNSKFTSVTKALPRLKKMGVNTLWLMPFQPIGKTRKLGSLGSPYSISNYRAVNPEFGTAAEFKALVKAIHAQGMHIIIDWVANHTAWDHSWITTNPEWYTQVNGNIVIPPGTNWNDVADLNYNNQDMRKAMISAMKYWVVNFDIDGFRCDAAGMVPADFWEEATTELAKSKKLFMLAEDGSSTNLLENAFTANYNWSLKPALKALSEGTGSSAALYNLIQTQSYIYPKGSYPLNFITNHDENSWTSTVQADYGKAENAMAVLTYTLPGMPLLYNGQEVGLDKQLQFFEKDPIDWASYATSGKSRTALYTALNSIKLNNPALWAGTSGGKIDFLETDNYEVMAFVRTRGTNKVFTVINMSGTKQTVSIPTTAGTYYALGATKPTKISKSLKLTVSARGYAIYSSKR